MTAFLRSWTAAYFAAIVAVVHMVKVGRTKKGDLSVTKSVAELKITNGNLRLVDHVGNGEHGGGEFQAAQHRDLVAHDHLLRELARARRVVAADVAVDHLDGGIAVLAVVLVEIEPDRLLIVLAPGRIGAGGGDEDARP